MDKVQINGDAQLENCVGSQIAEYLKGQARKLGLNSLGDGQPLKIFQRAGLWAD